MPSYSTKISYVQNKYFPNKVVEVISGDQMKEKKLHIAEEQLHAQEFHSWPGTWKIDRPQGSFCLPGATF